MRSSENNPKHTGLLKDARRLLRRKSKGFKDEADIVDAVRILRELRAAVDESSEVTPGLAALALRMGEWFRETLESSDSQIPIIELLDAHALSHLERELLLFMAAGALGIIRSIMDLEAAQKAIQPSGSDRLGLARIMAESSRLAELGLVTVHEREEPFFEPVTVSPTVIAKLLDPNHKALNGWQVSTQDELFDRFYLLFSKLRQRADQIERFQEFGFRFAGSNPAVIARKIERLGDVLEATLKCHAELPVSKAMIGLSRSEIEVLVILIGRDLGYADSEDSLFLGSGIAAAISSDAAAARSSLTLLRADSKLRKDGMIRVCGGYGDSEAFDDDNTLRSCEFELTDHLRVRIGIKRRWFHTRTQNRVRKPSVSPEQVVLSAETRNALKMIVAQASHQEALLDEWGFGKLLPYGRGVTVLFAGPPGVGKTLAAEAIAFELGRPILTVSYAQIQNKWVGETEKNVVRVFREAGEAGAVLFWDEADAMFFDRDSAYRNWEVRDVNVLLQELERFEGVCILATNRKISLDHALERRISLKVEFDRPDGELRRKIWRHLIPARLPIAEDVDFDWFAQCDLTGGEIKNIVLNAARLALMRSPGDRVTKADFEKAIEMEMSGRWGATRPHRLGFTGS